MSKQFWAIIAVIVIILGGIFFITNRKNSDSSGSSASVQATNHVEGSTASGVKLVEYGDFQCPACEAYYPIVNQVTGKYLDKIQFQFRNFPLTSLHPNAFAGARAAEAAALQNKYWQMHDTLYDNSNWSVWTQSSSPSTEFEKYAQQLGLNVDKFKTDFSSSSVNDTIRADMAAGNALNINATPTFFLDGKKIDQAPQDLDGWSKLIDAAIAAKAKS